MVLCSNRLMVNGLAVCYGVLVLSHEGLVWLCGLAVCYGV